MKVPIGWLGDLTHVPDDLGALAEKLTGAGLECALHGPPAFGSRIVTGKILSCEKHPRADRLVVCLVDVGDGEPCEIVCGAPNAKAGPVGIAALPGAALGEGFVIEKRKIRGVTSNGMLCSEAELGLSEESDGILLLAEDTPVGRPAGEVLVRESVLETEPSSNRGDWMSMEGVAREISALEGRPFAPHVPRVPAPAGEGKWSIRIEDPEECPRYGGRVLENLTPGPSPAWLAERLAAAGVRPLMNLVDVTNYVLLELGHPLHAFDLAKLQGFEIGVRRSQAGETLTTLDGKARALGEGTLVITDGSGPVATGGIMGGESTMVSETTRGIFLEGASFRSSRIRAGARSLRLTTDASSRFERGVDPEGVPRALDRCVELLLKLCPESRLVHSIDAYPGPPAREPVTIRRVTLRRILGIEIAPEEVRNILENLGLEIVSESETGWVARPPTFRRDLSAEEDLVEEVARVWGYDRIPDRLQVHAVSAPVRAPRVESLWRSRHILLSLGLTEVVTPTLIEGAKETSLVANDEFFATPPVLKNPLTSDRDALRGSLVPSLVQVLATNCSRSIRDLGIFELGRTFGGSAETGISERLRLAMLLAGSGARSARRMGARWSDFFDMKGLLEVYVEQFWRASLRLEGSAPFPLDAAHSAAVSVNGITVGFVGEIGANVRRTFDLPPDLPVFLAELDLDSQPEGTSSKVEFAPLPRFPGAVRDLAFVVPRSCRHRELVDSLREAGGEFLAEIRLFDVYEGEPLKRGEKSLAYTLTFRSPDRSLTNDEVDQQIDRIVKHLAEHLGARIR